MKPKRQIIGVGLAVIVSAVAIVTAPLAVMGALSKSAPIPELVQDELNSGQWDMIEIDGQVFMENGSRPELRWFDSGRGVFRTVIMDGEWVDPTTQDLPIACTSRGVYFFFEGGSVDRLLRLDSDSQELYEVFRAPNIYEVRGTPGALFVQARHTSGNSENVWRIPELEGSGVMSAEDYR